MVLCGDYGVGKTSLFRRFFYDDFWPDDDDDDAKSSVLGMDFGTREFDVGDGCSAKVDTRHFISSSNFKADGSILLFITTANSDPDIQVEYWIGNCNYDLGFL